MPVVLVVLGGAIWPPAHHAVMISTDKKLEVSLWPLARLPAGVDWVLRRGCNNKFDAAQACAILNMRTFSWRVLSRGRRRWLHGSASCPARKGRCNESRSMHPAV